MIFIERYVRNGINPSLLYPRESQNDQNRAVSILTTVDPDIPVEGQGTRTLSQAAKAGLSVYTN